jgi:hypothetical protein
MRMKLLNNEFNVKENTGPELLSALVFPHAISTMNSTTSQIQPSLPLSPR